MNPNGPPIWLLPVLFLIVLPGMLFLNSVQSGWRRLAARYRSPFPNNGATWWRQSATLSSRPDARFGLQRIRYRNGLNVFADEEGLGLSTTLVFRFGHSPLFIPWSDIQFSRERWLYFFERVRFTFSEEPPVSMWISTKLAGKIQQALGRDWFQENDRPGSGDRILAPGR